MKELFILLREIGFVTVGIAFCAAVIFGFAWLAFSAGASNCP